MITWGKVLKQGSKLLLLPPTLSPLLLLQARTPTSPHPNTNTHMAGCIDAEVGCGQRCTDTHKHAHTRAFPRLYFEERSECLRFVARVSCRHQPRHVEHVFNQLRARREILLCMFIYLFMPVSQPGRVHTHTHTQHSVLAVYKMSGWTVTRIRPLHAYEHTWKIRAHTHLHTRTL